MIKICQRCGKEYKPNSNSQKYCSDCKHDINLAYSKQYYADHKEERKAYGRQHYADHTEQHKARTKQYYADNTEKCKELQRQWRADNAEHVKAYKRQWCAKKRQLKKLEAKKLRLIAKMQANAAKRQAEQTRRKELYQGDSFWDNNLNAFAQRM